MYCKKEFLQLNGVLPHYSTIFHRDPSLPLLPVVVADRPFPTVGRLWFPTIPVHHNDWGPLYTVCKHHQPPRVPGKNAPLLPPPPHKTTRAPPRPPAGRCLGHGAGPGQLFGKRKTPSDGCHGLYVCVYVCVRTRSLIKNDKTT